MEEIRIKYEKGREFTAFARNHKITIDQPPDNGGEDRGPTPTELFISSLGSCIGVYVQGFCKRGGVPYEGMELKVSFEKAEDPYRISKIIVDVIMPEKVTEERKKAILKVAGHCLIHNTIANHPEVTINLS
jgi:putative redox protein